jgi:hypothetical protein
MGPDHSWFHKSIVYSLLDTSYDQSYRYQKRKKKITWIPVSYEDNFFFLGKTGYKTSVICAAEGPFLSAKKDFSFFGLQRGHLG